MVILSVDRQAPGTTGKRLRLSLHREVPDCACTGGHSGSAACQSPDLPSRTLPTWVGGLAGKWSLAEERQGSHMKRNDLLTSHKLKESKKPSLTRAAVSLSPRRHPRGRYVLPPSDRRGPPPQPCANLEGLRSHVRTMAPAFKGV